LIFLDTSVLVDGFGGETHTRRCLRAALARGEVIQLPSLVLYEWWRGPRSSEDLEAQERLFPSERALPFGPQEAETAAHLYASLPRARGREVDLAIAACAITWNAELWTLNLGDFGDIPGLRVSLPG
jgi:predicted nucleic acid-binding protein